MRLFTLILTTKPKLNPKLNPKPNPNPNSNVTLSSHSRPQIPSLFTKRFGAMQTDSGFSRF